MSLNEAPEDKIVTNDEDFQDSLWHLSEIHGLDPADLALCFSASRSEIAELIADFDPPEAYNEIKTKSDDDAIHVESHIRSDGGKQDTDINKLVERYQNEHRKRTGKEPASTVDENLSVLLFNHGYKNSEWTAISIHETSEEANWIAKQLRSDGHGAEVKALPLYRERDVSHTGTTNIGQIKDDNNE